ncbi:hypothetical protein PFISCL1PPCAC_27168 [Pristionchus fissidentatus]|uniref:Major facilitator superfamily (MFS) profile domain-containing protein n=1 Tax=Pristionchus fissidentatus TaxID=1538716 RepID=A0AAV5WXK9_9BILA|nr:hypothetical protein PFISCL1PPCAC_27168 [Pristionchus fissidentatus]
MSVPTQEELTVLAPDEEEERPGKTLEEFIGLGRYAVVAFSASFLIILSTVMVIVFMVYAGATPTVIGCGGEKFPVDQIEACQRYHEIKRKNESICEPVLEYQFESVNVEYHYLCDDAIKVKSSTTWQMAAILVGALTFGQLSDMYGRRMVMLVALAGICIGNAFVAHATSFAWFYTSRLAVGFFAGGTSAVHAVYIVEHARKDHRMLICNVVTWSPNFAIAPLIAYYAHDWRTLSLVSAIINVISFIALFLCSESPRFLIQKGRIDEARSVLARIRSINGDSCEIRNGEVEKMMKNETLKYEASEDQRHYTYFDLLTSKQLLVYTLVLGFGISVTSLQNYGIIFNTEKLSGSLFLNGAFFGIIRWIVNLLIGYLDYKCAAVTRKRVTTISKTINLICLAAIIVVFMLGLDQTYAWVVRVAAITVLVFCGPIFTSKFLCASELYPTSVRNVGNSFQSMSARVGTIFGTTLFILTEKHKSMPYWILAIFLFVDIFLYHFLIPETKGSDLKDEMPPRKQTISRA